MHPLGLADQCFIRGSVPMTKAEARTFILGKAAINATDVVLDIGAGTGSITVEAALLAKQGKVYAVERQQEGVQLIQENCERFGVDNVSILHGMAPQILPQDILFDVIIIGGSGGAMLSLMQYAKEHLRSGGRMIVAAVTLETVQQTIAILEKTMDLAWEAVQIQSSRLVRAGNYHMYQANNPIHVVACIKE